MEVADELVGAGCEPSKVLEAAEGVLDQVATLVAFAVIADRALAARSSGDDGHGPGLAQRAPERVSIIAFVAENVASAAHAGEQLGRSGHVGDVAGREHQRERAADDVGECVDLGRPTAARATDRLRFGPLFPPNAERWALM